MITLEDLHFSGELLKKAIQSIDLTKVDDPTSDHFADEFARHTQQFPELADPLRFLGIICSWRLRTDDERMPFDFLWAPYDLNQITKEQLESLSVAVNEPTDPELLARFHDLIWICQRDHSSARSAAEQYFHSADRLIRTGKYFGEKERLQRAVQLATMVGRSDGFLPDIVLRITQLCERPELSHCTLDSILTILSRAAGVDSSKLYRIAVARAQSISAGIQPRNWERRFWELAADFARLLKDGTAERDARRAAIRTFEREAEMSPLQAVATQYWQMALKGYRNIVGADSDRERVHQRLLAAQSQIKAQMSPICDFSDDITELVNAARDRMGGKEKRHAIAELVLATKWLPKKYVREQALEQLKRYPLQHLFSTVQYSSTWKKAATAPGGPPNPTELSEVRIHAEMCKQFRFHIPYAVSGTIEPMRYELLQMHNVALDDVAEFVVNSPFLPPGREAIYVVGIHAGLHGQFIQAIHVLIPQLEHLLRHHLNLDGVITSSMNDSGIQQEFDLNRLLIMSETEKLLGVDLCFLFRVLFTERHGYNLRNEISHGMKSSHAFFYPEAIYSWWLLMHIIACPWARTILAPVAADNAPDFVI